MEIVLHGRCGRSSRIALGPLGEVGRSLDPSRTVIVTDRLIRRIHGVAFPDCPAIEVERGEAAKTLASLEKLYGAFLDASLGRDGVVLAIGGGAVSDLAGFAASTWLRGVDFGFAPTTLLAMVDASVGGKNGVDFRGVKNLVGCFAQPSFVTIDVGLLATLPDIEFASGMAEVIKHAVLAGGEYFELVEAEGAKRLKALASEASVGGGSRRPDAKALELIVAGSVRLKVGIVERDERESGLRRKLNLGHSVGHGIEAATGLPHGHCVAAGLGTACALSRRLGRLSAADCDRITRLLVAFGLPPSIGAAADLAAALPRSAGAASGKAAGATSDGPVFRKAVAAALLADKKRVGGDILMAIPEAIGSVSIEAHSLAELQAFIMEAP